MANLRVVYNNAADRSTVTASTTAGTLVATNLLNDYKVKVWRSTGTSADIELTWASAENISMASLPFCNLSATATMRVRCYTLPGDVVPTLDTGTIQAVAGKFGPFTWSNVPAGANTFSYGGGACATLWFATQSSRKVVISLSDASNSSGYLEAARVVCGTYWSPENNAEYGATIMAEDMSRHERTDSGDLHTDRGPRYRKVSVTLPVMPVADRDVLWQILMGNGMARPVFFSLTPEGPATKDEHLFQLYCKLSRSAALRYQMYNQFNSTLELEEV